MAHSKGENTVESPYTGNYEGVMFAPVVKALRRIRHMIRTLPWDVQESRSVDYAGPEPGFIAAIAPSDYFSHLYGGFKDFVVMDSWPNFYRLFSLFRYPSMLKGGGDTPELISKQLSDCLGSTPGFFVREWVPLV